MTKDDQIKLWKEKYFYLLSKHLSMTSWMLVMAAAIGVLLMLVAFAL